MNTQNCEGMVHKTDAPPANVLVKISDVRHGKEKRFLCSSCVETLKAFNSLPGTTLTILRVLSES